MSNFLDSDNEWFHTLQKHNVQMMDKLSALMFLDGSKEALSTEMIKRADKKARRQELARWRRVGIAAPALGEWSIGLYQRGRSTLCDHGDLLMKKVFPKGSWESVYKPVLLEEYLVMLVTDREATLEQERRVEEEWRERVTLQANQLATKHGPKWCRVHGCEMSVRVWMDGYVEWTCPGE